MNSENESSSDDSPEPAAAAVAARAKPRTFAHGTGVIFQSAGLFLMMASCCLGSFFGLAQSPDRAVFKDPPPATVFDRWGSFAVHQKLATLSMFGTCIGGLGALAAGIGMQSDRYGSPRLAMLVSVPLSAFHIAYVLFLVFRGPLRFWFVFPCFLMLIWSMLALLAIISARVHAQHPPPKGLQSLPPGFSAPATAGERLNEQLRKKHDPPQ